MNAIPDIDTIRRYLTPAERAELDAALTEAAKGRVFFPTARQLEVLNNPADVIGYGGAAGGGKSYLLAGLTTVGRRTAIIRPQKNQTKKFVQELTKMLGSRDGYAAHTSSWTFTLDDGVERYVEFFGLDNPGDEEKQQGVDFDQKCVGAGTLVWMADGSRKAVEHIRVGDMVDTLEGPRRVTRTIRQTKPAVLVRTISGSQVQGFSHHLLSPAGWHSSEHAEDRRVSKVRETSFATPTPVDDRYAEGLSPTYAVVEQPLCNQYPRRLRSVGLSRDHEDHRSSLATDVGKVGINQGSDVGSQCGQHPIDGQHLSLSLAAQGLTEAQSRRLECAANQQARRSDGADAPVPSSLRDYPARCLCAHCRDDAQLHLCEEGDQPSLRLPGDAGPQNPIYLLEDGGQQTPTHNRHRWSWPHPYTKETRTTDRQVRVVASDYCDVGVVALFDLTVEGANHYITQQGFINRNCYDEVTQMREADIRYTLTWNRTDDPDQRVRSIFTMNPPTTTEGRWVIKFFAPWLDPDYPADRKAQDGELRWFATVGDNKDYEVAGPQPFVVKDGKPWYSFKPGDYPPEKVIKPKSRTFIRARVTDNPYYMATDYISQLQALPEPLRSQMLNGDFMAGVEDDARQVIPTKWIEAAQERWKQRAPLYLTGIASKGPMDSVGVDVARGGNMGGAQLSVGHDELVISRRHGTFFDELKIHKGIDINSGDTAAALIISQKRDDAPIHIDVIGVGTSVYDFLKTGNQYTIAINAAAAAPGTDASGLLRFSNRRAEYHWRMREALDPSSSEPIALPPDPQLLADLAAPRWSLQKQGIVIESKDDIKKRLGRSPDRGEAVMFANIDTPKRQMLIGGLVAAGQREVSVSSDYEQQRLRELER